MDKKELEIVDSIKKKRNDIFDLVNERAEKCSLLIKKNKNSFSDIKFEAKISTFTDEEKVYVENYFYTLLRKLVNTYRVKPYKTKGLIHEMSYKTNESFILKGIIRDIKTNDNIKKVGSIFGDYYSVRNIYNHTGAKNNLGQSQRNKLIKDGIITRLSTSGKTKLFVRDDRLEEFLKIRLKHYKKINRR